MIILEILLLNIIDFYLLNYIFNAKKIEQILRLLSEELRLSFRKIAEVIRIAIWGSTISPPLFETIEILGKEETLKRLECYKNILINTS